MEKVDPVKRLSLVLPSGDPQSIKVINDWCVTKTIRTKHFFTWTIEDFSQRKEKNGQSFKSSIFPAEASETQWKLKLYPRGCYTGSDDYISIFLCMIKKNSEETIGAKFSCSLLNYKHEREHIQLMEHFFEVDSSWGYDTYIKRIKLKDGLLPDDKLTVYCELETFGGSEVSSVPSTIKPPVFTCTLSTDLWSFFENQKSTDIIIIVGSREFKAHKAILMARSPVFNGMFSHDMEESQSNQVEVSDVNSDVFNEILRYIYTGKVVLESGIDEKDEENQVSPEGHHSFVIELLRAANKYQLDGLKLLCEYRLFELLSVDSVVDILCTADQCQVDWLKDRAIQFAILKAKELTKKSGWKSLSKLNSEVLAQIMDKQWPADSQ